MGLSAWPLSRYSRCRPSSRTSTAPTSRSTRRCLDTCGWARPSSRTRSFTGRSPPVRRSRICRRRGSATALNASAVVAALAIVEHYIPIWEYVKRLTRTHDDELVEAGLGAPQLAGPTEQLPDVRRGARKLHARESLAPRVEVDEAVRAEVAEPDGVALVDVDRVRLRARAREPPLAPAPRGRVVPAELAGVPLADP